MIRVMITGPGLPLEAVEWWMPAIPQPGDVMFVGNDDWAAQLRVVRVIWYVDIGGDFNQPPSVDCEAVGVQPNGFCEGVPFWRHPDGSDRAAPPIGVDQ